MKLFLRIAFRSLGRRPGRTALTLLAMGAATALLILSLGLLKGMIWDIVAAAAETYHGHAKAAAPGYLDHRRLQLTMDASAPPRALLAGPGVLAAAGRVRGFVLLSAGEGRMSRTQPAELLGVSPEEERRVSRLELKTTEGRFLSGLAGGELVLGRGLARRLDAGVGDELAVMGQAADGSLAAELFKVVGLLDTGDKLRDSSLALVGREDLQSMLALEGRLHEYALALERPLTAREWARAAAPLAPGVEVAPWNRFLPMMTEVVDASGAYRTIYATIFYFAVVLVTMNTMYMALLERLREFAVMGAVGLKPSRLAGLLLLEALLLSGIAAVLGGLAGTGLTLWFERHPLDFRSRFVSFSFGEGTWEPVFRTAASPDGVLFPVALTALIGAAVALLPAWKLYRLRPVEVLREV